MSMPALPPPVLIQDPLGLRRLADLLARSPTIAMDTESNSLYAYQEKVCLIQISLPAGDFILDSLAVSDLESLRPVLTDPGIEKIFHAVEYDLICLRRDFGFELNNLFDTMVAARTLGWKKVGLASILEERYGVTMNKRFQRADWGRRPLTPEQLAYARLDTHFLIPLRNELKAELLAAGRWEEAREEFERATLAIISLSLPGATYGPQGFWRIAGARDLKPQQQAVLRELYLYRDAIARRLNRPPFKVIGDLTLLGVAQDLPSTGAKLKELPGMTPGQLHRHQQGILSAVHKGKTASPPKLPRTDRVSDEVLARYDALHAWRKKRAAIRGVESDVILPREVLWELARRAPRASQDLLAVPGLMPWRRETYGEEILAVLNS